MIAPESSRKWPPDLVERGEALDPRRQQLLEPAREECLGTEHVLDALGEVVAMGVDRADHDLVAEHEALVDPVDRHLVGPVAAGDAGEDEDAVGAEDSAAANASGL